jgi:predicted dehydrogenase
MRVAVLGLGFMGATHVQALLKIPSLTLAGVSSSDEKKLSGDLSGTGGNLGGAFAALDFSQVKKFRRWEDALADREIDAVDITLPTALHATVTQAALRAGKHVLVEKPLALDGAVADSLIAEARKAGRVLMAAQVLRFFPMYRQMADLVHSGSLGAVKSALFRRRCAAPGWAPWMKDKSKSGGGVFDLLIHDVDFMLHLMRRAPVSVSASGAEALEQSVDTIAANFQFGEGASVTIAGGWHHGAFPFSMEYSIVCEGGTIDYHLAQGDPKVYRPGAAEPELLTSPEGVDGFVDELKYFGDCCTAGRKPDLCPPEDSAAAVKLTRTMADARHAQGAKIVCRI